MGGKGHDVLSFVKGPGRKGEGRCPSRTPEYLGKMKIKR